MDWPEPPELPDVVEPDADSLLARLGKLLQIADLHEIAGCDHGYRAAEHLDGLCRILDGDMPRPLLTRPAEVLILTRWSEPEADLDPYAFDAAHRRRAFACAALLRSLGNVVDDEMGGAEMMGPNTTLIQLVASLRVLGDEHDAAAAAFLQWLIPRLLYTEADEAAFFGLALLWFVLPATSGVPDAKLLILAEWVMVAEGVANEFWHAILGASLHPWLLATTDFNQRHEVWRDFAGWLEVRAYARPALCETVALMAAAMREPTREG